ncbi:MAG: hypothetical protein M3Y22_02545, partial [Pseudomonadota bacterium]|nr:hypothetical protein [Pseudomonadota bacterium]
MKLRQYPLLCALILLNCAQSGIAQSEPTSIADVAPQIDTAERIIDAVAAAEGKHRDEATLAASVARLQPADQSLDAAAAILDPRLAAIDARLQELGLAPPAGQPSE